MIDPLSVLRSNLEKSIYAKQKLLEASSSSEIPFVEAAELVLKSYMAGGRLYIAGNGGSAADAQHLAAEFVSRLARDRDPLPAEALTVDTSILTAIGNDYGYEQVFSRQISGKLKPDDIFLGISTSGNSPNILKAFEVCGVMGVPSILLSGDGGGRAKSLATVSVEVPSFDTATIQEMHLVIEHSLCEYIEAKLFC